VDQKTIRYIFVAAAIAAVIILVELVKSKALAKFWDIAGAV
jgi:hypothetical protein